MQHAQGALVQQQFPQQCIKTAVVHHLPQLLYSFVIAQIQHGIPAIQPGSQGIKVAHKPRRLLRLLDLESQPVQAGGKGILVQTLFQQTFCRGADGAADGRLFFRLRITDIQQERLLRMNICSTR